MNSMSSFGSESVKNITCKRSSTALDVIADTSDSKTSEDGGEKRHRCDFLQLSTVPRTHSSGQSFVLPLLPIPKVVEPSSNGWAVFTGAVCRGKSGPPVGAVDIGVSKYAYYFCIALPGVKKDPGEFSCKIQSDGKVCVQGVTSTGGKVVKKYSRVFEMKIQQQCPPGPITLFFSLPGPVDPRLFSPSFRSDGVFEAVVAKYDPNESVLAA